MITIYRRYLSSAKVYVYNILKGKLDNFLSKTPLFWTFRDSFFQPIVNYIEPYVNAFIDGAILNIDMGADFAAKELDFKIQKFKEK